MMKKRNIRNRLLSGSLAVAMVVSLLALIEPTTRANAAETTRVYGEDFENGAVMQEHGGSGSRENSLETEANSYLKLTGLSGTVLSTPEITVEAGTEYTLSFRIKAENVSGNFYFHIWGQAWTGGAYESLTPLSQTIRTDTDGWQTVSGNYTVEKSSMQIFFEEAWGGSADVSLDDITLINTATGEVVYRENFDTTEALTVRSGSPIQTRVAEELSDYYLKIAGASTYAIKTDLIYLTANKEYVLSYRVKTENVSGSFYFYVSRQESDDGGNYSGLIATVQGIQADTDGWQTVEVTFTPEKNRVQLFFEEAWGGSGDVSIDDITLKAADGSDTAYANDFSGQKAMTVHYGSSGSQSFERDGNHYLQISGASSYAVKTDGISLEANAEYTLSYRVKVDRVSGDCYIRVFRQEWDDAGNYTGILDTTAGITAVTDGWQTITATFTAEKNHVQFFFEQAWPGSADFCIDDIVLVKNEKDPVGTEPTEPEEDKIVMTKFSFNRVVDNGKTWFMDATNVTNVTGTYYFGNVIADGTTQKVVFEKTNTGFVIYEGFFTVYGGTVPTSSLTITTGTVLTEFDPNVSWSEPVSEAQTVEIAQNFTVKMTDGNWNEELPEPEETEPLVTEPEVTEPEATEPSVTEPEEIETVEMQLSFNRVVDNGKTWFMDATNIANVTGTYYFGNVIADGTTQKVVFEKTNTGFVIYEGFFTVYGGTVPTSSLTITTGSVLTEFDPNVSWNDPAPNGQRLKVSQDLSVKLTDGSWKEENSKPEEIETAEIQLSFNRVVDNGKTWFMDATGAETLTAAFYFGNVNVDGTTQKVVFEKTDTGFVIYEGFFTVYGGTVPASSLTITKDTVLTEFDPNVSWNDPAPNGQRLKVSQDLSVKLTDGSWKEENSKPEETVAVNTVLSFNRMDGSSWFLNATNISSVSGKYYYGNVTVDGTEQKIAFEKTDSGFVIYEGFFTVYGGKVPTASFAIAEETILYPFDPDQSWTAPITGVSSIKVEQTITLKNANNGWEEYREYVALDFALFDYTTVGIGSGGWQCGTTTSGVSISNGMISGKTGDTVDANVLTLETGADENLFALNAGTEYRFTVTYRSAANLMFFCGNWIPVHSSAMAAADWQTISVTFTADNSGKMPIYVQNWGGNDPQGQFQIKAMYIAKVSDSKNVKEGQALGTLPSIDRTPSEDSYQFVWSVKNDGAYTQVAEDTLYDSESMGKVLYATQIHAPHSSDAHWWTSEGATVTEHICSVCGAKEKHSYSSDNCTVCQYDMSQALHFALLDYATIAIGQGGWEVDETVKNLKQENGIISGTTGGTSNAVLSLFNYADLNPFEMQAGETYRISLTFRSDVKLMIFCDDWVNFTKSAEASEDWRTLSVTITPDTSRKLAIYIQNWDGDHPVGDFQIKDIYICNISDSRILKDGEPIGTLPTISYEPSSEFNAFAWQICMKENDDHMTVNAHTAYDSNTMGTIVVAKEIQAYHSILNYVRCDFMSVDSWNVGCAMKAGTYSNDNGILSGTVLPNTSGQEILAFTDGADRITLEAGVEYKVILTYQSSATFGVFMNLKSNAWVEAPGKCLASTGQEWKTVTATFKPTAGDTFNGVLIQSWNEGQAYSFKIKDFCIVKAVDCQKFAGNERLGDLVECESENDALNRYVYQWVVYTADGEAIVLSEGTQIRTVTSALNETGMLYAYEKMQCVYHMGVEYAHSATCLQEGWGPYWQCTNCGKYFSDAMCTQEITDLEAWKTADGCVQPTGHIHTTAMLGLDGTTYYYCTCGKLFKREGESYVEVPVSVLDKEPANRDDHSDITDLSVPDADVTYVWWIVIALVAVSLIVLLTIRSKRHRAHPENDNNQER